MSAKIYEMTVKLVGSTFCDGQRLLTELTISGQKESLELVMEPDNRYDPNAVRVEGTVQPQSMYEYVSKKRAATIAKCVAQGATVTVVDYQICGCGKEYLGLYLHIELQYSSNNQVHRIERPVCS